MFTSYPNSGESLWDKLIYSYSSTYPSDIELTVTNSADSTDTYIKKLYSVSDISVNVAPLFRYNAIPEPVVRSPDIYVANGGYAAVVATCQDYTTTQRVFTLSKDAVECGSIMTSMPAHRIIALGESDIIRIFTSPNEPVIAELHAMNSEDNELELKTIFRMMDSHAGMLELVIDCLDVEQDMLKVIIYQSLTISEISYTITKPYQMGDSVRLAWLSSAGSLEHHTFPIVKSRARGSDGAIYYTLLSAYAPDSYVTAVAEVVSSPAVWVVESDGYRRVEVASDIMPIKDNGSLSYLELKIRDNG